MILRGYGLKAYDRQRKPKKWDLTGTHTMLQGGAWLARLAFSNICGGQIVSDPALGRISIIYFPGYRDS